MSLRSSNPTIADFGLPEIPDAARCNVCTALAGRTRPVRELVLSAGSDALSGLKKGRNFNESTGNRAKRVEVGAGLSAASVPRIDAVMPVAPFA